MEAGQRARGFLRAIFLFGVGRDFYTAEYFEHLLFCWGIEDIASGEVFGLGITGVSDAVSGLGQIVGGVAELNIWAEQYPMRAGFAERHSNAAGVYDSGVADFALKLHVGVSAHNCCGVESFEERQKAFVGGQASEYVVLVLRGGVAEQDGSEPGDFKGYCFWPSG